MYPTDGRAMSNPSPAQISMEESGQLKSERRGIVVVLVRTFVLILGIAGVSRLVTGEETRHYIAGAFALLGVVQLVVVVGIPIRRVVGIRRMNRGLCPWCKYDLAFAAGRCPECGADPFDW